MSKSGLQTVGDTFGLRNKIGEANESNRAFYHTSDLCQATQNYWHYRGKGAALGRALYEIPPAITSRFAPMLGVEVETENVKVIRSDDHVPAGWAVKPDGSLRNGSEYVSFVASPEETRYLISSLYLFFANQLRKLPDFSWRTSIHVHLNVRPFTIPELANLQLIYSIFEPLLFQFAGGNRDKSNFCVPLTQSSQYLKIRYLLNPQIHPSDKLVFIAQHWEKYSALNFSRMQDLGTVEFRHMSGTWDTVKLGNWLNLIVAVHDAALSCEHDWVVSQINSLNSLSTYGEFRNRVFGAELGKILGEPTNFKSLLSSGVSWAKQCLQTGPSEGKPFDPDSAQADWASRLVEKMKANPLAPPKIKSKSALFSNQFIDSLALGSITTAANTFTITT